MDSQPTTTSTPDAGPLDDPRALTILTTEHWSLLSARALVYNEAFTRGGMFLAFLSTTLVGLGLVWTGTGFSRAYLITAAVVLAIDLFVGLASLARILTVTEEDARYVQGMNRLRHAYHEMVPGLDRYFVSPHHDDAASCVRGLRAPDQRGPDGHPAWVHDRVRNDRRHFRRRSRDPGWDHRVPGH